MEIDARIVGISEVGKSRIVKHIEFVWAGTLLLLTLFANLMSVIGIPQTKGTFYVATAFLIIMLFVAFKLLASAFRSRRIKS